MDKWVILFKGGIETQEFFSVEMSRTFEARGWRVYWFDLIVSEQSALELQLFLEQHKSEEKIIFTFNFHGISYEPGLYGRRWKSGNIWDDYGLPVYNMVVDHPLYYHKNLEIVPKRYVQLSIDRNHISHMERFFPNINASHAYAGVPNESFYLPLGGTGINMDRSIIPDKSYLPLDERPVDVIFTGNYTPPERFEPHMAGMDEESREFFHQLLAENIAEPDQLTETLLERKLMLEHVAYDTDALRDVCPNLMYVDLSIRFYYRAKVITALADSGIRVDTYGAGWDLVQCEHPENIVVHGNVNSRGCLDMISQSKISINVMPWFKNGAHDRVFNSMLNGAAVVSDPSIYLESCFDDASILFYDLKQLKTKEGCEKLGNDVKELLSDKDRLEQMIANAYTICENSHTWACRTNQFIDNCLGLMV
jgi:hypothetical protein